MSTDDKLRPIRDRLSRLPEPQRVIIEAMVCDLLDIPRCGPHSALEIVEKTLGYILAEQIRRLRKLPEASPNVQK